MLEKYFSFVSTFINVSILTGKLFKVSRHLILFLLFFSIQPFCKCYYVSVLNRFDIKFAWFGMHKTLKMEGLYFSYIVLLLTYTKDGGVLYQYLID